MSVRIVVAALVACAALPSYAQTCLDKVRALPYPISEPHTWNGYNFLPLHRPSRSLNGFDITKDGLDPNAGLGLKQALEAVEANEGA